MVQLNEGPVQRGNGNGGPTTPKPVILPKGQASARAALAAAPEGEPSDQELYDYWIATSPELGCADPVGFARAVLARWGHQPAPLVAGAPGPSMEDVGPLIAWLTEQACQAADASQPADAGMLTWAAQVIGERVNEDAPVAGEVAELVDRLRRASDGASAMGWAQDSWAIARAAELLQQQQAKIESLEQQLETERMRVVACGIIATSDTPFSAAKNRNCHPDYWSASADDIARQIDELMRLRAQQTPVPVNERLPGPGEMDGSLVWCGSQAAGLPYWEWCLDDIRHPCSSGYTHWLPANTPALPTALPLPQGEVE